MSGFGGSRIGTIRDIADAIYVADAAARLALTGLRDGQLVVEIDTNQVYSYDAGSGLFIKIGGSLSPSDIGDTNTIDHTVTASVLTSDVVYQDTNTALISDDASGLKVDVQYQDTNSIDLSDDASGLKADLVTQNTSEIELSVDASGLKADVAIIPANKIEVEEIGTATYDDVQDVINIIGSSGLISGCALTDNGDGTVDVAAGTGFIRILDSNIAALKFFDIPATAGIALTDNSRNYIYVDYNAGTPIIAVTTADFSATSEGNDDFDIYEIYREGVSLHITNHAQYASNVGARIQRRLYEVDGVTRASGLIIGETGTRNITVTAGSIWVQLDRAELAAIDTSGADTFLRYYRDGVGGWTEQVGDQTQWDNTQYDDGSGTLVALSGNFYSNQYFWIESDGTVVSLYGQAEYALLSNALNESVPSSIPPSIQEHALFIGRIVFQKNAATATAIQSVFSVMFSTSAVTDHNELANIQGGTTDEYYHLTSSEYTALSGLTANRAVATDASGDLTSSTVTDTELGQLSGVLSQVVGESDGNTLTNKTIDADNNTISNLAHGAEVDNPTSGVHGVVGSVVGTSDAQVLTAKDIDGGTASDTSRITIPKNTTANLAGLTRKEATLVYDTTLSALFVDNGATLDQVGADASVVTTEGDLIIGDSSGDESRLAIGGNATVLTSNGTTASWQAPALGTSYSVHSDADNYIVLDDDGFNLINFTDTSSDRTCTLPTPSDNTNRVITIINTSSDQGKVTIGPDGAETIGGYASVALDCKGSRITVISDGTNWQVLEHFFTDKIYTPTVTGTGWTTIAARCKPYRGLDGVWKLNFIFSGTPASEATNLLVITGVSFLDAIARQSCAGWNNGAQTTSVCYTDSATDEVVLTISAATSTARYISGDVYLNSKPTFVE